MDSSHLDDLASALIQRRQRFVLAESCTGGLVASTLARLPGVSQWMCGSLVVYRHASKIAWLDVNPETLNQYSAVSSEVAQQMAIGALLRTGEANWSAAVTGHLGPHAPEQVDGVVFFAIARRDLQQCRVMGSYQTRLPDVGRVNRQVMATAEVLSRLIQSIDEARPIAEQATRGTQSCSENAPH